MSRLNGFDADRISRCWIGDAGREAADITVVAEVSAKRFKMCIDWKGEVVSNKTFVRSLFVRDVLTGIAI